MQKTMAFKTARDKLLVIEDEYPEPFISARKTSMKDREQLTRLFNDIKKGRVQNLLVYKRDRLARLAHDYMYIYRILKEYKVNVVFTADNEPPISYTAVGDFFEVLMAGVIQREGEQIAKRIRDSKVSKFLAKQYAGKLPFGYHIDEKAEERIVQTPGDIEIARELYDLVLTRKFKTLNDTKGYFDLLGRTRIKVKKGKVVGERSWTAKDMEKILTHPLYMGTHSMTFEGAGEFQTAYEGVAIVTLEEWEDVQDLLPAMITTRDAPDGSEIVFHADGLLYCAVCHQPLITKERVRKGVKLGMYECSDETHECKVRQSYIEPLLLESAKILFGRMVKANLNDLIDRYHDANLKRIENAMGTVLKDIKALKDRIVKRTDQYLRESSGIKKQAITDKMLKMYEETRSVQSEYDAYVDILADVQALSTKPKELRDQLNFFLSRLDDADDDELRALLGDVIARVDVSPKAIDIVFKHPYVTSKEVLTDVAT